MSNRRTNTPIVDEGVVGVSDTERERVSTELRAQFTAGHLGIDEFSARLDEVWAAATMRDIERAERDLALLRRPHHYQD